jgi:hypothetical protein
MPGIMPRGLGLQSGQNLSQQPPPFRPFGGTGAPFGQAPPGLPTSNMPFGRGFPDAPPGLPHQFSSLGGVSQGGPLSQMGREPLPATSGPTHSRQTSFEQKAFDLPTQPIARPVALPKRASSAKPNELSSASQGLEIDDITRHLGSSALLDDSDDPIPLNPTDVQRQGPAPGLNRGGSNLSNLSSMSAFGASPIFTNTSGQQRPDPFGSTMPNWGTPPMSSFGGGPGSGLAGAASWGNSPTSGWTSATSSNIGGFNMNMPLPIGTGASGPSNIGSNMGVSGGIGHHRRGIQIRINICNACRQLMAAKATNSEGYVDAATVLRHVQDSVHPAASLDEMLEYCETEGNASNGGGNFQVVKRGTGGTLIKFEPDPISLSAGPTSGRGGNVGAGLGASLAPAGDIGAPSVGATTNVGGTGTPFGSLRGFPFGTLSGQ